MARVALPLLLGALVLASAPVQAGTATVTYVDPQHFTDAALRGGVGAVALRPALDGLRKVFERQAAETLPADQTLVVEVTNLDLAGRIEPWRVQAPDLRILRDVDWPRIALRYRLEQNGQVLASGEEVLSDVNYLLNARMGNGDPLLYGTAVIGDWFRKRFPPARS